MQFNHTMRRMNWLTFARLHGPSFPSLIRHFYMGLSKPNRYKTEVLCTLKGVEISLEPPTMCKILGLPNEGDELPDTNSWSIVPRFDPQAILKRLCKVDSWHPKPHSKHITLTTKIILLFVLHNIIPKRWP